MKLPRYCCPLDFFSAYSPRNQEMRGYHVIRIPRIIALIGNEADAFHVLRFATRAVLNNAAPMYSRLVLAWGDKNEDGLLEAWELTQMDLRAELVVLSACETALGRFGAGEGVIGLTWARAA